MLKQVQHDGIGLGMRALFAVPLLAACQSEAPANNLVTAEQAPAVEGDVGAAQRLVRENLGNAAGITFAEPRRSRSEGVTVICGSYLQNGGSRRYIAIPDSEQAFVEPQMGPGEMDRAFVEFCNQGAQTPGQPAPPPVENAL